MFVTITQNAAKTAWLVIGPATPGDARENILTFAKSRAAARKWATDNDHLYEGGPVGVGSIIERKSVTGKPLVGRVLDMKAIGTCVYATLQDMDPVTRQDLPTKTSMYPVGFVR